jgi:hypothetical protein
LHASGTSHHELLTHHLSPTPAISQREYAIRHPLRTEPDRFADLRSLGSDLSPC